MTKDYSQWKCQSFNGTIVELKRQEVKLGLSPFLNFASKVQLFSEFLNPVFKKPDFVLYFKNESGRGTRCLTNPCPTLHKPLNNSPFLNPTVFNITQTVVNGILNHFFFIGIFQTKYLAIFTNITNFNQRKIIRITYFEPSESTAVCTITNTS